MSTESNPFGLSLLPGNLKPPEFEPDRMLQQSFVLTDPKLNVRSIQSARPTNSERGLASYPGMPEGNFFKAAKDPGASIPVAIVRKNPAPNGLNERQAKLYNDSIRRAASWLPKARKEWESFIKALETGKALPEKVTRALRTNFGWTNTYADNHNLPHLLRVIDRLSGELNGELPASFHSQRELSPFSSPGNPRWVRARPGSSEDESPVKLVLYPDFFQSNSSTSANPADARAKTIIHELLHTWEKAGGEDWSDVAQEDQRKDIGFIKKYLSNPASYSGLIHDLAN